MESNSNSTTDFIPRLILENDSKPKIKKTIDNNSMLEVIEEIDRVSFDNDLKLIK